MAWRFEHIGLVINQDVTDPGTNLYTFRVVTPECVLQVMADVSFPPSGKEVIFSQTHIQGTKLNTVGSANLRAIGLAFCEANDYDELTVYGGLRTTGACPGRTPGPFRFKRRRAVAGAAKTE
jgi:hypothetical protein